MVKLFVLFLSCLLFAFLSSCSQTVQKNAACDCSSKEVRDSIADQYLDHLADKFPTTLRNGNGTVTA